MHASNESSVANSGQDINRRTFLKACGLTAGGLLLGCGPSLQEVNKGVENVAYDCNPIFPIPKQGCYTGTNDQDLGSNHYI